MLRRQLPAPHFQFSKHLGLPGLLKYVPKKESRRKGNAANYAGKGEKQLSSFWKQTCCWPVFAARIASFCRPLKVLIILILSFSVFSLICSVALGQVPEPSTTQCWLSMSLHVADVCAWLDFVISVIVLIIREREKIETGKQKKERRMRQGEMQPNSAESLWQRFIFILNDYRRLNCGRNKLSCSEMLQTVCYQPDSQSNLLYSGLKSILTRVKGHTRQSKSSSFRLFSKPLHTVGLQQWKSPVQKLKSKNPASLKRGGDYSGLSTSQCKTKSFTAAESSFNPNKLKRKQV